MYATEDYIRLVASGLSAKAGVTVTEGKNWSVDVRKKVLNYKLEDLKYRPFPVVRGFLLHEIGHLKYTPITHLKDRTKLEKKYPNAMQSCYNTFEDIRIERKLINEYGSFAMGSFHALHTYSISHNYQQRFNAEKEPRLIQFLKLCLLSFYFYNLEIRIISPADFFPHLDPTVVERFRRHEDTVLETIDTVFGEDISSLKELKDLVDSDIYPIIKDFIEEFEKTAKQPAMMKVSLPSWLAGHKISEMIKDMNLPTRQEALALLNPYISTLSTRLRDILLEKKATKWRGVHLRGKLLSKNAYKVTIPKEKRIFSKRTTPDMPDYSVYVALDSSGSMTCNSRGIYASLAAFLLEEVCHRLKFKVRFYFFTEEAKRLKNASEYKVYDAGTNDFSALKLIREDINFSDNNLVIFITDGETHRTAARGKIMTEFKRKKARVYGIGIGDKNIKASLKSSYKKYVYVPEISKLPLEMIRLLRREIKR